MCIYIIYRYFEREDQLSMKDFLEIEKEKMAGNSIRNVARSA